MSLGGSRHDDDTRLRKQLDRWQRRRTPLALVVLPDDAAPGPREPQLVVRWWWQGGARTVLAGTSVVSLLHPRLLDTSKRELREIGPHATIEADQLVVVGRPGPGAGAVEHGREVTLRLSEHLYPGPEAPTPLTPPALEQLLDRPVSLTVDGGRRVTHHGLVQEPGTSDLPQPQGHLVAVTAAAGHVVLVLDDGTVAVLHEPLEPTEDADGTVRLAGDLGRVVLDLPTAEAHVVRDATLVLRPLGTG